MNMVKIFNEVEMNGKIVKLRLGYKAIRDMERLQKEGKQMTQLEALEQMLFLALKDAQPEIQLSDIEDMLDNSDMEEVAKALDECVSRDMPGLKSLAEGKDLGESEMGK
jgi:cobalamin biosynthesis protein CobD/CbiB